MFNKYVLYLKMCVLDRLWKIFKLLLLRYDKLKFSLFTSNQRLNKNSVFLLEIKEF